MNNLEFNLVDLLSSKEFEETLKEVLVERVIEEIKKPEHDAHSVNLVLKFAQSNRNNPEERG